MSHDNNVWVKKTETNRSSDTLLQFVLVFLTQTLHDNCLATDWHIVIDFIPHIVPEVVSEYFPEIIPEITPEIIPEIVPEIVLRHYCQFAFE